MANLGRTAHLQQITLNNSENEIHPARLWDPEELYERLDTLKQKKLVTIKDGPNGLKVVNYGHKVQVNPKLWSAELSLARGLVFRVTVDSVSLVATPWPKFFNRDETDAEDHVMFRDDELDHISITEKKDGSLVIFWVENGEFVCTTKGSFNSDQSAEARRMLEANYSAQDFTEGWTYMAEIIYPENRIVVDYRDYSGLYLLGVYTAQGLDVPHSELEVISGAVGMPMPEEYEEVESMAALQTTIRQIKMRSEGKEGVVICYRRKDGGVHRHKLKTLEYKEMHKAKGSINEETTLKMLKKGKFHEWRASLNEKYHERIDGWSLEYLRTFSRTKAKIEVNYEQMEEALETAERNAVKEHKDPRDARRATLAELFPIYGIAGNNKAPYYILERGEMIDQWVWGTVRA